MSDDTPMDATPRTLEAALADVRSWRARYASAVHGRQLFRAALRAERAKSARLLRVAEAAREVENTLTAYERGDCSRTAITVARGHLAAALAALEA